MTAARSSAHAARAKSARRARGGLEVPRHSPAPSLIMLPLVGQSGLFIGLRQSRFQSATAPRPPILNFVAFFDVVALADCRGTRGFIASALTRALQIRPRFVSRARRAWARVVGCVCLVECVRSGSEGDHRLGARDADSGRIKHWCSG